MCTRPAGDRLRSDREQAHPLHLGRPRPKDVGRRGEDDLSGGGVEGGVREPVLGTVVDSGDQVEPHHVVLCGDLFTQPGAEHTPVTEGDILGPSEAMRQGMDYYAHSEDTRSLFEKLAATKPRTLACMHGSAWAGDGRRLLLDLADALSPVGVR